MRFLTVDIAAMPIIEIERNIEFKAYYYDIKFNFDTSEVLPKVSELFIEKCKEENFGIHKNLFTDPANQIPINVMLCLNNKKIKYSNGTINYNYNELNVLNEWGAIPSTFPRIELWRCKNNTSNGNKCAQKEDIDKMLKDFYLVMKLPNYYIDLNDYENPYKPYIYSFTTPMTYGTTKNMLINLKKSNLYTDFGYVLQEIKEESYVQIDHIRSETNIQDNLLCFFNVVMKEKIEENNFRKYVKVQDLIANIGGMIKFLIITGTIIISYYSEKNFVFNVSNHTLCEKEKLVRLKDYYNMRINNLVDVNNLSKIDSLDKTKTKNIDLKLSFNDFIKSYLYNKKNIYDRIYYNNAKKFVDINLNILFVIKQFSKVNKITEFLLDDIKNFETKFNIESINDLSILMRTVERDEEKINLLKQKIELMKKVN